MQVQSLGLFLETARNWSDTGVRSVQHAASKVACTDDHKYCITILAATVNVTVTQCKR